MKIIAALLLLSAAAGWGADYGAKTRFSKDKAVDFPDCALVFTGTTKVESKIYPRGFVNYNFRATAGGKAVDVAWSAGTGLIAPRYFSLKGTDYVLELKGSAAFKAWMKDDELVLWKKADFEKIKR